MGRAQRVPFEYKQRAKRGVSLTSGTVIGKRTTKRRSIATEICAFGTNGISNYYEMMGFAKYFKIIKLMRVSYKEANKVDYLFCDASKKSPLSIFRIFQSVD